MLTPGLMQTGLHTAPGLVRSALPIAFAQVLCGRLPRARWPARSSGTVVAGFGLRPALSDSLAPGRGARLRPESAGRHRDTIPWPWK
ncbi:hypothetical protein [Streptomyces yanii]|uniref:hypothetical protein n=1 Tax=Streptomyces yanii TaxID=78510 RepID=UPI0031E76048